MLFVVAYAQERTISGRITSSEDASPLPGVNVLVKGTTVGTVSDADGKFSVAVPNNNSILVFSFIGYTSQEVSVGDRTVVDTQLGTDMTQLSEVVVVGYGTQTKQDLTGNIASVSGKDVQNIPVPTFEQALQGRAAGVFIEAGNGKLGQGIKIRIRGSSSVSAGNQPLYVIDGIPITSDNQSSSTAATNPLTDINPTDIESIQILKDASAAAIYGSRAANGVVLITTKRGKTGKTNFTIGYQTGVSEATGHRDWLNTAEYVELFREARNNTNGTSVASLENRFTRYSAGNRAGWENPGSADYIDHQWEDEVLKRGNITQFDLGASGGNEKTKFYASTSWSDQEGILVGNKLQRLSGRLNLDHQASEKLKIGVNFSLARTKNFRLADDNAFSTPMQIVALSPMNPAIDPRTGLTSGALDLTTGSPNSNFPLYYNPILDAVYASRETSVFRNLGSFNATYNILSSLSFTSEVGYDLLSQNEQRYYGKETLRNIGTGNGYGSDAWTQVFNYTANNFLRYDRSFGDNHVLDAVLGMSFQESHTDYTFVDGQQFPSNSYKEIQASAKITDGDSQETGYSILSYFLRANYKFKNRFLLGVSGRVDGSSRFGPENRYGFFPAASAGWIISEESFLKENNTLSFLKLRASYGITGNSEIGNFPWRGLYSGDAGYGGEPGQRPSQPANRELGWEQTAQVDIGLDYGLFNGRITGELDYYSKHTTDLLLDVNLPGSSGFLSQTRNIGELENKGFEVVINSENLVGELKWSTNFNYSRNINKITNLQDQVIQGSFLSRAVEGEPIGVFFGPKYAGVDPANGDALYYTKGADGNLITTNDYNAAEYMVLGNPNPDFIAGITNTLSYKGIELMFLFQGVFGNQVYNGGGKFMSANGDFYDNQTRDQLNRWREAGDITDVPQARLFGANGTGESSRYVLDADYIRLKTVTLAYSLPNSLISKAGLSKVRLYVSGQNIWTITDYPGWDPEVNSDTYASNVNQGIDFYSAPQAKSITFGVNIGF
jgi:TonB-linked SusC/RagA family outer membrane protein